MTNLARQVEYGPRAGEYVRRTLTVSGTKATTGPTTVIPAPAATQQIIIVAYTLQNETTTAQTILLANTAGSILQRVRAAGDGDGISRSRVEKPVGPGLGLSISISAAAQVGYSIDYYVEDISR